MGNFKMVTFIVVFLFIWFETDAIPEWANVLRFHFMKAREYFEAKKGAMGNLIDGYPTFLVARYNNFWTRLLECPICFSVWLNVLGILVFRNGFRFLAIDILATWLMYAGVRYVIVKGNA